MAKTFWVYVVVIVLLAWLSQSDSELRITFMWFAAAYGLGRGGMYIDNRFDDLEMRIDDLELRGDCQNGDIKSDHERLIDGEIEPDRRIFEQPTKENNL